MAVVRGSSARWVVAWIGIGLTVVLLALPSSPAPRAPMERNVATNDSTRRPLAVAEIAAAGGDPALWHISGGAASMRYTLFLPRKRAGIAPGSPAAPAWAGGGREYVRASDGDSPDPMPAHATGSLPLLVYLHGAGETGTTPHTLHTSLGGTGSVAHLAALHPDDVAAQPDDDPHRWSVAFAALQHYAVLTPLSALPWLHDGQVELLGQAIDEVLESTPAIDPRRVIVTGASQGGYGALRYAALRPSHVAAAASVCGFGEARWAAPLAAARLPVLFVHGDNDDVVPVAQSVEMVDALRERAGNDPAARERVQFWRLAESADALDAPGLGHAAWRNTYADQRFWDWCDAAVASPHRPR